MQKINLWVHICYLITTIFTTGLFALANNVPINNIMISYLCFSHACMLTFAAQRIKNYKNLTSVPLFPILITILNLVAIRKIPGNPWYFWDFTLLNWGASILYVVWKNHQINNFPTPLLAWKHKILLAFVACATVFICTTPMSFTPKWLQEYKQAGGRDWGDQYENMGDSLLQGRLYLSHEPSKKLLAMNNPYSHKERAERGLVQGVDYHWDHAFYRGKYYMYFGVVPSVVLFAPYQYLTGKMLTGYHGTQVFTALAIFGIFALFALIIKIFSANTPFSLYLTASAAFSVLCIHDAIKAPGLYGTAIISGVCFAIWSLYFFLRAGWLEGLSAGARMLCLFLGALCGALVFGCRPPIGLASAITIPVAARMLHIWENQGREKIIAFAAMLLPYAIVGTLLALYNYMRFDSPFEFGQRWQLTYWDQTSYGSFLENFSIRKEVDWLIAYFFAFTPIKSAFPFIARNGAFFNFPILLSSFLLLDRRTHSFLKAKRIRCLAYMLLAGPVVIALADAYWSPILEERYRLDSYFLLCAASFTALCAYYEMAGKALKKTVAILLQAAALAVVPAVALMFFVW